MSVPANAADEPLANDDIVKLTNDAKNYVA